MLWTYFVEMKIFSGMIISDNALQSEKALFGNHPFRPIFLIYGIILREGTLVSHKSRVFSSLQYKTIPCHTDADGFSITH